MRLTLAARFLAPRQLLAGRGLQRCTPRCAHFRVWAGGDSGQEPTTSPSSPQSEAVPPGTAGRRGATQPPQPPQPSPPELLDTNYWSYKPVWCQPWSIVATGGLVVSGVWQVSGGSPWWTAAAVLPVAAWWALFLVIAPAQFRDYVEAVNEQQQRQWATAPARREGRGRDRL